MKETKTEKDTRTVMEELWEKMEKGEFTFWMGFRFFLFGIFLYFFLAMLGIMV
jgi:hypothetical protein